MNRMKSISWWVVGLASVALLAGGVLAQTQGVTAASGGDQALLEFGKNLRFGASGSAEVKNLQTFLTSEGYYAGPLSGNFFSLTRTAVKKFQADQGVSATGYFGPKSRAVANVIIGRVAGFVCPASEGCNPILPPFRDLTITTDSDLHGKVGQSFSAKFQVSGGSGSYSIRGYGEPSGLSWTQSYCPDGNICAAVISTDSIWLYGTPKAPGKYSVTIVARDQNWRGCKDLDKPCPLSDWPARYGKATFTVVVSGDNSQNKAPVIYGVRGPTNLNVGEEGVWTIQASDPNGGSLSYSVIWGDETPTPGPLAARESQTPYRQTATFAHAYSNAGEYTILFRVVNDVGLEARTSITVQVGNSVPVGKGVIRGTVTIGPTCPVEQLSYPSNCGDKPYQTTLQILDANGNFLRYISVDANGKFEVRVAAGTYTIGPLESENRFGSSVSPVTVTVREGETIDVHIMFDSGIR